MVRTFLFAALVLAPFAARADDPFTGEWDGSEHVYLRQKGNRVCGLWRYLATGREYEGRLVGTAEGNVLKVKEVCGTPGGRTRMYCAESAPKGETEVGWTPSTEMGLLCKGRLNLSEALPTACPLSSRVSMWDEPVQSKGRSTDDHRFEPADIAWAKQCAAESGQLPGRR
jgi:hypothetical protein